MSWFLEQFNILSFLNFVIESGKYVSWFFVQSNSLRFSSFPIESGKNSRFAFEKDLPYFLDKLANGCKYAHRVDLAPQNELLKEVRTKGSEMSKNYKLFEIEFNKYLEEKSKIKNFVEQFKDFKNVALLCSEHTTEKCHRRLVIDMLQKYFSNDVKFAKHLKWEKEYYY